MANVSTVSFYLEKTVDHRAVLEFMAQALKEGVEDVFSTPKKADISIYFENTGSNYPLWLMMNYPSKKEGLNTLTVARLLSMFFQMKVITNVPDGHPLSSHPYKHCLCLPNGSAQIGVVDMDDESDNWIFVKGTLVDMDEEFLEPVVCQKTSKPITGG